LGQRNSLDWDAGEYHRSYFCKNEKQKQFDNPKIIETVKKKKSEELVTNKLTLFRSLRGFLLRKTMSIWLSWCWFSSPTICDHKSREVDGGGSGGGFSKLEVVPLLLLLIDDDDITSDLTWRECKLSVWNEEEEEEANIIGTCTIKKNNNN